jgi:peptidyl-prolyl cis-trans isomerase D
MFDLFRSRDKLIRYMLGGLLLLVALSMVTYLIPSYNTSGVTDRSVLADIAGRKITALYAQEQFRRVTKGTDIPQDLMDVYLPQFIDNMILQRAAVYQAERMGLTVNDDEVLTGMILSNPQFFPNGQLSPEQREQLEQYFAQQGQSLDEALQDMRDQLTLRKLQNALLETTVVSPKEVEEDYIRKYDKVKVQYIAFPPGKFRDQVKLLDDEVRRFWENNRSAYVIPERYTFRALVIDQAKVESSMAVDDAQLRQAYAASMDNFRMPERIQARHILFKTDGRSDAEKKSLMAKAQDLVKQLKAGADFGDLAQKNSDDAGTADKAGDLGWLVRGQTAPEFEAAAFTLKPKEISAPVTSQFGIHIIQVLSREPARVRPFEEVREELAKDVRQRGLSDKMQQLTAQVHTALLKSPGSTAEIAKQYDVQEIKVEKLQAGQAIPGLGVSPEIEGALPALQPGQVSEILVLPADRVVVVSMESKTPARMMDFDEAADRVRETLTTESAGRLAEGKAKEAAERLKKGQDIDQVARSYKLEVTTSSDFGVNDSVEGLGSAVYLEDAFRQPVGGVLGPSVMQGRNVVSKVVAKTPANMAALGAEHDVLLKQIKQRKAREQNDLLLDSILTSLMEEGKVRVYREEIQKLVAAFRNQK